MSIQEIFNYYSIKNQFLCLRSSEILEQNQEENQQIMMCKALCQVIDQEDFFLMTDDLRQKLLEVICAIRFRYYENKELFAMKQHITDQASSYQNLEEFELFKRRSIWLKEEGRKHDLLFSKTFGNTVEEVFTAVEWDPYYLKMIFEQSRELPITNTTYFLATVNLLLNEYSDLLKEQTEYRDFIIESTKSLITCHDEKRDWVKKKTKKTIHRLENLEQGKKLIRLWKK
ncbi:MAG TPA: hypothetical protein IAB56_05080 [Candidatus Scybalousia intestinigallinarum]|nr:hypothetical protein [Candidatus Scybalousia intestinigallinarum]